jgi:hypothetical protein
MTVVYYPLGRGEEMSEGEYVRQSALGDEDDAFDGMRFAEDDYPTLGAVKGFWETKEGALIALAAMTDKHVRNALRWMRARGLDGHPKYNELHGEHHRRARR